MPSCSRVLAIPGPQGVPGTSASAGTNGSNAYTTTLGAFTMPAEQVNVTVTVGDSTWMVAGQNVFVGVAGAVGTFQVVSKPNTTSVILNNLEDTATSAYTANSAPGTVFAVGAGVSPGSVQGPTGGVPVGALLAANNLNDLSIFADARSNLGLGTMAVQAASAVAITGGTLAGVTSLTGTAVGTQIQAYDATLAALAAANWAANALPIGTGADTLSQTAFAASTFPARASAGNLVAKTITDTALTLLDDVLTSDMRTTLGLVIGTNVQAFDATLQSLSALGTASERYAYTTGVDTWAEGVTTPTSRALLTNASIQLWNAALGGLMPRYGRLGSINNGNMNSTADITLAVDAYVANTRYRIDKIMVENASTSLTTATAGVFTAAGGGGTTVAATQVLSALTSSTKWLALTLEAVVGTDVFTASPLYFRVVTPQGGAATACVHLFGWSFDSP